MNISSTSYENISRALEILWTKVIQIRKFTSDFLFFYSILLPKEYVNTPIEEIGNIAQYIPTLSEEQFHQTLSNVGIDEVECKRLFVGEKIWMLFTIYRIFGTRMAFKVVKWSEMGILQEWDRDLKGEPDKGLLNLLHSAFTKDELDTIINILPIAIPQRIQSAIEDKILNEMNQIVFGEKLLDIDFKRQQQITVFDYSVFTNIGGLTMDDKRTEILMGDNATIHGNFIVASSIKHSFNKIASSNVDNELKSLLEELTSAVEKMCAELSEEESKRVVRALDTLVDEATSREPERKWWSVSVEGLSKAAKNIGQIGKPVLNIIAQILPFLEKASS